MKTETLPEEPLEVEVTEAGLEVLRCRDLLRGSLNIFARHHDQRTAAHLRTAIREELEATEEERETEVLPAAEVFGWEGLL